VISRRELRDAVETDTYRGVAGRFAVNDAVNVDADGRLHVERIKAIPEPKSLIDLRKRVNAMLPRVDLPEVLLELMGWDPGFAGAFTSVSGSRSRLAELDITIAACLTAHALNIGYGPVVKKGVPALERDRVGHVGLNYRSPGRPWKPGLPAGTAPLAENAARPIRIGYARCSTAQQELASQIAALEAAQCKRIFSEKISTRIKVRPELERALRLAREIKEAAPDQPVILTVHELKRLARNAAELMPLSGQLQAAGIQLELLAGPLTGIYDPDGMGSMLFAVRCFAVEATGSPVGGASW
jgi:hypothetical protein